MPCERIADDPLLIYDYTAKGNLVAVISNGSAVLGLGNLGASASKPVMEGKAVLFKRFADVDSIDLEVDTQDVDEFINCVRFLSPSFGGINLEDIRAPECFVIEQRLRELMDIPVFHDDQHGTAIISSAGLLNALNLTGRRIEDIKMVVNGAGAAGIACIELVKAMGARPENTILCDTKGVIYRGRESGMNQWKSAHAVDTKARTLSDAMKEADVFFGLSVKGAVDANMVANMADQPILFVMANPDPEILPEEINAIRDDAIVATGRSDYPNQVNNVLGFPYIFRGALDVRASTINNEMKIAAAHALASLAREDVPDEGICDGDIWSYCDRSGEEPVVLTEDCGASFATCGEVEPGVSGCTGQDECGDLTLAGRCEGTILQYCAFGVPITMDCAGSGQLCGLNTDYGESYMDCITPDPTACGDETYYGRCDDDTLIYCWQGAIQMIDCASYEHECAQDLVTGYNCRARVPR